MLPRSFLHLARSEAPLRDDLETIRGDAAQRANIVPASSGIDAPRDHIDGANGGIHASVDHTDGVDSGIDAGKYPINPSADHIVPGNYLIDAPFGPIDLTRGLIDGTRRCIGETKCLIGEIRGWDDQTKWRDDA